jgi:putative DNA primase/helicase
MRMDKMLPQPPLRRTLKEYLDRNEVGDAELFASIFAGQVVYDHSSSQWYLWRGNFWEPDRTGEVYGLISSGIAAEYSREASQEYGRGDKELAQAYNRRATLLRARKRADAVLHWAAQQEGIGLNGDEWDSDPMVLGVKNGVINLETGEFRPGRPTEYLRAHSSTKWRGLDCPAPAWEKFLREIFGEDEETCQFIQRLLGYAITGKVIKHVFPILWGAGRNGKTTLVETLSAVLGPYLCLTTQAAALMESRRDADGPRPFVHALRGKRIAWAKESKEGQWINAALVKELTGGDTLNARTLYTRPITFAPTHKVMLITNPRPHIPADDQALWDRVLPIEFPIRFVDNPIAPNERKKDEDLLEKLRTEASGILAWLVRGCLEWQEQGLQPPAKVLVATQAYRKEEDTLGLFLDETYEEDHDGELQAKTAYKSYQVWAHQYGIPAVSLTAFGKGMKSKLPWEERRGNVYYKGIRPKA